MVDLESLSDEQRETLIKALVDKDPATSVRLLSEARRKSNAARARQNQPREVERKTKARNPSIGARSAANPRAALQQLRRTFGEAWREDSENPAVSLISCESTLCGRINKYTNGRWTQARSGADRVVVRVKLKDGTEQTREFVRSDAGEGWK